MASIQQKIDELTKDEDLPLGVISLEGVSGSFDMPEGLRLVVRNPNGPVTCNSAGGRNELNVVGGKNVSVKGFKQGIVRLERCESIDSVEITEQGHLSVSGSQIESLDLTKTQATMMSCTLQSATFTNSEINSHSNTYQDLTVKGGTLVSDSDEFQKLSTDKGAIITSNNSKGQDLTLKASVVTLNKMQSQGDLELEDCQFVDNEGKYQQLTAKGSTVATFRKTQFEGQIDIQDGALVNLVGVQAQSEIKTQEATVNFQGVQAQSTVEIKSSASVVNSCDFSSSQVTLESSSVKMVSTQLQELQVQAGALESESNQINDTFEMNGGTITSTKDTFPQEVTLQDLVGPNTIWKSRGAEQATISGADDNATFACNGMDVQQVQVSSFGRVDIVDCNWQQSDISDCRRVDVRNGTMQQAVFESIATLITDDVQMEQLTVTDVMTALIDNCQVSTAQVSNAAHFLGASSQIQTLQIESTTLATSDSCETVTADSTTLVDNSSTVLANDSVIISTNGDVTAQSCLIQALNGNVTSTGNGTVIANGAQVENADGLTIGTGFDPTAQAGCVLYDGALFLQANIGDVNINATTGSINLAASQFIAAEALADITLLSSGLISADGQVLQLNGDSSVTITGVNVDIMGIVNFN